VSRRGWILFALLSIAWGIPYLLIKIAVAEVPVSVLVFARVTLGAAILLPVALHRGQFARLAGHWGPLAAFATLEFIIPWGLLSHAEIRLSSSTAGLLMAAIPILAVVITRLGGHREHLGSRRLLGLVAGFAGVFVLAAPDLSGDAVSVGEVLLAAVCYAAAAVLAGRRLNDVPGLPMTAACLAMASLAYLPPAVAAWPATLPSPNALAALAGLAFVCTALAFVWFFALIREVGVTRAVVITYINPAVAVAAGAVVLSETITPLTLIAFALILGGSVLATVRPNEQAAAAQGDVARRVA
jgi:drug/metabolite transporter (DMT)-like permease